MTTTDIPSDAQRAIDDAVSEMAFWSGSMAAAGERWREVVAGFEQQSVGEAQIVMRALDTRSDGWTALSPSTASSRTALRRIAGRALAILAKLEAEDEARRAIDGGPLG